MVPEYPLAQLRREVDACIDIWTRVLEEQYPLEVEIKPTARASDFDLETGSIAESFAFSGSILPSS
jgi:hypothetical protein